jgi:hypothetical protein
MQPISAVRTFELSPIPPAARPKPHEIGHADSFRLGLIGALACPPPGPPLSMAKPTVEEQLLGVALRTGFRFRPTEYALVRIFNRLAMKGLLRRMRSFDWQVQHGHKVEGEIESGRLDVRV